MVQLFFRASAIAAAAAFFAFSREIGAPYGFGICCAFAPAAQRRMIRVARNFTTDREDILFLLVSFVVVRFKCRPHRAEGSVREYIAHSATRMNTEKRKSETGCGLFGSVARCLTSAIQKRYIQSCPE